MDAVERIRTEQRAVALTYDDGPDPEQTPRVLAALEAADARATFFILVTRARRHPDLVRSIVAQGCEVALHGADHRPATQFSATECRRRTAGAKAELERIAGTPVRFIRPAYGLQTIASAAAARANGLTVVLWNRTALDWTDAATAQRVQAAAGGARAGDVLLAHDGHADARDGVDDGPAPTLDRARLAAAIVAALRDRGLAARSVGELRRTR